MPTLPAFSASSHSGTSFDGESHVVSMAGEIDSFFAHSWVIWDVINIAWLIDPDWVPSQIVATPVLGHDKRWRQAPGRPPMREVHAVARDAIFADFFTRLAAAPA